MERKPSFADDIGFTLLIRRIAAAFGRLTDYFRGNAKAGFITLAVVIALAALVTMAVAVSTDGPSEPDPQSACWAKRQTIIDEMEVVDSATVEYLIETYLARNYSSWKTQPTAARMAVLRMLNKELPDC